jgi:hypothetical protein
MTNAELYEFLFAMKSELKAEIKAQNTIIDEVIKPTMLETLSRVKETNGRVTDLEKNEIRRALFCEKIQEGKAKSDKREKVKVITQIIISAFAAALMVQYGVLEILKVVK